MDERSTLAHMEHWGYYLLPKAHPASLGYSGLVVAIRDRPTREHYDPESIHLHLREEGYCADRSALRLHVVDPRPQHACPGRLMLHDRTTKQKEFFTFGGTVETISTPGETVYTLSSPAPFLEIVPPARWVGWQLADETEALLAEYNARWGLDEDGFAQRLGQVDPLDLYQATISAILDRFSHNRTLREEYHVLYHALVDEKEWYLAAGLWPATPPALETLLAPNIR